MHGRVQRPPGQAPPLPLQSVPYPMLLPSSNKFTSLAIGLRSLLISDEAEAGRGIMVRRRIVASRRACGDEAVQESGDGQSANRQEDEEEGLWVSYGHWEPWHRLPLPIPSLEARSTLRRTSTEDRRLVITKVPIMRPDYYVRSRRRSGRLVMQLVQREDDSDPMPPAAPEPITPEDYIARAEDNATALDACDVHTVAAPPSSLPAAGCFEDVAIKCQYAIDSVPLHQMPILRTVVH